jgi:class 3 adenylate cyclase
MAAFVGRERELAELRAGLDDVCAGHGRLFLLSGEPGTGKTRLAEELAIDASRRGMRVVWGRCWEGGGAPAYWPLIQILRACVDERDSEQLKAILGSGTNEIAQLFPDLKPSLPSAEETKGSTDPESARFRLFDAVATLLKNVARVAPLLILVDDLHDADQPSLQMVRFIARAAKDVSLLIVGTYRDAEVKRSPQLGKLVGDLLREGGALTLTGLSKAEVGDFIANRTGRAADERLVADLYRATDGNALYVEGVVRLLESEGKPEPAANAGDGFKIPDGVRESIRRQLDTLSNETKSLLSIASVIGNEFETQLLERVAGRLREQVVEQTEEAVRLGILRSRVPGYARQQFSHALVRDVLYRDLSANERTSLHSRMGAAIEEIHQKDLKPQLAALAHHHKEAGNAPEAIKYSIAAGEAAHELFAFEEAEAQWVVALELLERQGGNLSQLANLLRRLANLSSTIGFGAAISYGERALTLYERLRDEARAAQCHALLGTLFSTVSEAEADPLRASEHYRKAEAILSKSAEGQGLARLYIGIAQAAYMRQRCVEGMDAAKRAMEVADRLHDQRTWAQAATQYGLHLCGNGRLAEGWAVHEKAWQVADRLNAAIAAFGAAWTAGGCNSYFLNIPEAQRWYRRELDRPRVVRAPQHRRWLLSLLAEVVARAGDLAGAQRLFAESGLPQNSVELQFLLGKWQEAETQIIEQSGKFRSRGDLASLGNRSHLLGNIFLASGKLHEAKAMMEEFLLITTSEPRPGAEMQARPALALICTQIGQVDAARQELARCHEIIALGEDWFGLSGSVMRAEAVVAAAEQECEEADADFQKAIHIFRKYQVPFEEAEALYYWGRALNASGAHDRANQKLDEAINIYRRCGAGERWVERVEAQRYREIRTQGSMATLHGAQSPPSESAAEVGAATERRVSTIMFLDIVNSTEHAARVGDSEWKRVIDRYFVIVRNELKKFRGREVDTSGDGFFALFGGPGQAIRCACAIRTSLQEIGLQIRVGIHTGECEFFADKVVGIAVHIGARVIGKAEPGEVIVSATVKDLVAGAGHEFSDRGAHELRGIPGEWRLFAVR